MEIKNYFSRVMKKNDNFLDNYDSKKRIDMWDVLSSKRLFYPGAGYDMTPIDLTNIEGTSLSYIFCDYLIPECEVANDISYPGYRVIDHYSEKLSDDLIHRYKDYIRNHDVPRGIVRPYKHVIVFKREDENVDGNDRFLLIYYGMDAIFLYNEFYRAKPETDFYIGFIKDHGFGCNYTSFGNKGLLHSFAIKYMYFPRYLITQDKKSVGGGAWRSYKMVDNVEPYNMVYNELLYLYHLDYVGMDLDCFYDHKEIFDGLINWGAPDGMELLDIVHRNTTFRYLNKLMDMNDEELSKLMTKEDLLSYLEEFINNDYYIEKLEIPLRDYEISSINDRISEALELNYHKSSYYGTAEKIYRYIRNEKKRQTKNKGRKR